MTQARYLMRISRNLFSDLAAVLEIEALSFTWRWSREDFLEALHARNTLGRVIEVERRVVGFVIYRLRRDRVEILNLAIHPSFRRQGHGAELLHDLLVRAMERDRSVGVMVREGNLAAQLFFKAMGLRAEAVFTGHYQDTGEDGYWFRAAPPGLGVGETNESRCCGR